MRKLIAMTCVGLLVGCGGHALDTPIKTCKAVTIVLAGNKAVQFYNEKQEEQGGKLLVTLDFSLVGQAQGEVSQAVCTYAQSSQDMDYRNAMGEYANTPSAMTINGSRIPTPDLVQAVNLATANTAQDILQGRH